MSSRHISARQPGEAALLEHDLSAGEPLEHALETRLITWAWNACG